jgi:hypothetical protein
VELESVTVIPLIRALRPSLWRKASGELDGVAARLAAGLGGTIESRATVTVGGVRGRRYEFAYEDGGSKLRERLTFLLSRKTEYQLLCRWEATGPMPDACALLETTFRPS